MPIDFDLNTVYSESDVEQKLVLPLLVTSNPDGLGFSKADFKTKPSLRSLAVNKGTSKKLYVPDYAVILAGRPLLIIEAKRPGEDLAEALREARMYASELNAMYPAGDNPCQRIIVTDGSEIHFCHWDSSDPVVVRTDCLTPIDIGFSALLDFAGKQTLSQVANAHAQSLRRNTQYVTPIKLMGGAAIADAIVGTNSFGANVSVEYKYLFDPKDTRERTRLVENAYVGSERRASHVAPIDRLIRAAIPAHMLDARAIANTLEPSQLLNEISPNRAGEMCLLIGSVGSGKSTFTDYLRVLGLSKELGPKLDWANVNLNPAPLSREKIYLWLIAEISKSLAQLHPSLDQDTLDFKRKIFARDIAKAEKGRASLFPAGSVQRLEIISDALQALESNAELTLKRTLEHLYRDTGRLLIVVLDNCDKRAQADQLLMFEVAMWLKENMHCMVFLPLRDTTYDNHRNEPPLDTVVKDLVFRIDPPALDQVIQARLDYAVREMRHHQARFHFTTENGMKVDCSRDEVGRYLSSLVASVFQNSQFKRIITGLAGRNIRKGIEILLEICRSGHIPSAEIFKARTVRGHKFPSHLVMQILMKGNRKYYADASAHLKNLFHSDVKDALPDPFARLAVLRWLQRNQQVPGPSRAKGFHKLELLIADLQGHGFAETSILSAVRDLIEAECIYSEAESSTPSPDDLVSIAPAGDVHLSLCEDAQYLASVAESVNFRETLPASHVKDVLQGLFLFAPETREGTLEIADTLTSYLADYLRDYHLGAAEILNDASRNDPIQLDRIRQSITQQISNSRRLNLARTAMRRYPKGSVTQGTIASVFPNAAIVVLDNEVQGYLRCYGGGGPQLVVGDSIQVRTSDWSVDHGRLQLSKV